MLTGLASADDCKWDDEIPCTTIYAKYTNNSNALGDKITPTKTITKSEIQKYNLIDLPKVLNYVQGLDITQSGSIGQQSSVFMRGTNSNHTLVLLNGIPINDYSTPTMLDRILCSMLYKLTCTKDQQVPIGEQTPLEVL